MEKYICIHGHFYQPPRENAWLEVIEVQDSAHPYHDWNERISAECYAPNAASRILESGVIKNIVNNYSRIRFNFGPTLLSWMETNDPETYNAVLEADKESQKFFDGHGSALAQVFNHIIMWLAETAVDIDTLEALAEHNIKFTILAPRQAKAFRRIGEENWHALTNTGIDPRKVYKVNLPSGKSIAVFFFDGEISQGVAFNG